MSLDAIGLSLFASRLNAVCEEMGTVLRHAAVSSNIKDRLDFSCALFDRDGHICAQAAHIPVHLGSMAHAMRDVVGRIAWQPGDVVVFNDPRCGGTHLPDVTVVMPVFVKDDLAGFAASRAHHAHIGEPEGSMPLARRLEEEGEVFPPSLLRRDGQWQEAIAARIRLLEGARSGDGDLPADWLAQLAACERGVRRLGILLQGMGKEGFEAGLQALNAYGRRLVSGTLEEWPEGEWRAQDVMDDDGWGNERIPLGLRLIHRSGQIHCCFEAPPAVDGNINCPLSVTAAAAFYAVRCLLPPQTPSCHGVFSCVRVSAPEGSLLNAPAGVAVGAGNVETSQRVVDLMQRALAAMLPERVPALSQGTMNNVVLSGRRAGHAWHYYETLGGGHGAGPGFDGLSARQVHMTNTLNTPVEVLETLYPVRVESYSVRRGSGGKGRWHGGDGLVRSWRFLAPARVTLLTERRRSAPAGLAGGFPGLPGVNLLNGEELPAKVNLDVATGDLLTIETPGGGGYASPEVSE